MSPAGRQWRAGSILARLRNETYIGTVLYNKTSQKLKTPRRHNPPEDWVRSPEAFDGLISLELFIKAQELLEQRRQNYEPGFMLEQLNQLYQQYGVFRSSLLRTNDELPKAGTYARHFGSLDLAFQQLYREQRDRAKELVHERIREHVPEVLPYSDFLVLDQKLTLAIEPTVPIPHGYTSYWPVRPDSRQVIDITLGVLLSDASDLEILGYVALPRWFNGTNTVRFGATSTRTELFGRSDLTFLQHLL